MKLYRIVLAVLLVLGMVLPMVACSSTLPVGTMGTEITNTEEGGSENDTAMPLDSYTMKELESSVRFLGERTGFNSEDELVVEWSGSGFEINIIAGEEGTDLRLGTRCNYSSFWNVFVDGEQWGERVTIGSGRRGTVVARGISPGEHTIAIVKDSEPATNKNNYNSLLFFDFNGELLPAPEKKDLYIEFIGDGYMTGCGILGNPEGKDLSSDISFTASLPYQIAKALDADYSVVAHSKIGLATKAGSLTLGGLYANRYAYRELETLYEPTRVPDVIVIHAGMDDTLSALPMGEFIVQAENFITTIREGYGKDVPVVWMYNTLYHTNRANEIQALVKKMGPDAKVYAFEGFYGRNGSNGKYAGVVDHKESAELLLPFLQELIGK